jgi:hypothetical protein
MSVEERTRITLLLPAPTTLGQFVRVDDVLTELVQICGGVTSSSLFPAIFLGRWFDPQTRTTGDDDNLLIIADALIQVSAASLIKYLESLKFRCQIDFAEKIIFITVHPVNRIATHDPVQPA